ncbi:hypothetical protein OL239_00750 [Arthrobacter sp. ATA002]|uniref:hypothetical protein n=1 Tax=Arthrobacter sp. ATA002 TaxID=2991715 RepID=UPI0022A7491A|nr:hypothetical protein [Arthrobacter sp. ATA002]WAP51924.1 hypothetical protein OL239_00750 [Arthrobacter sp. ATA002]
MVQDSSKHNGKDPAETADNPVEALMEDGADFVPDGTGDPNETDDRVEVHASISEGTNAASKTSGTTGSAGPGRES